MSSRLPGRAASGGTCVAIDLGATAVRAVELEWGKGSDPLEGARIIRRGTAPLPPGAWNDLDAHREAFAGALQHALSGAGITGRAVVACLPRRLVNVRYLKLPHAPPEQMSGMVAFEAQQYVLFPLDDVVLDHHVIADSSTRGPLAQEDLDTVLLVAARRSMIAGLMRIFDSAGLNLRQLSVSALALAENISENIQPTALVDVEPGEIDVVVVADRQLLFTRASAVEPQGASAAVTQQRTVEEIFRSFTAYQNEYRTLPLARIYSAGAGQEYGMAGELERALSEALEMPVQPYSGALLPTLDPEARSFLTAIGMALQTLGGNIAGVNLVPRERALKRAQQTRGKVNGLLGVAALALLVAFGFIVQGIVMRQASERARQRIANGKLNDLNERMQARQQENDAQKATIQELVTGLDHAHPTVDVLVALDAALPHSDKIWITQFSFERGKTLTLRGEAKSSSMPLQLVLALQRSHAFRSVQLSFLGDAQESANDVVQNPPAVQNAAPVQTAAVTPLPSMANAGAAPGGGTPAAGGKSGPAPPGGPPSGFFGGSSGPPNGPMPAGGPPPQAGNLPPPPGGGGPVPSVSPPPGGIQPAIPPNRAQPAPQNPAKTGANPGAPPATRSILTSFAITCRVNLKARTLVPAETQAAADATGRAGGATMGATTGATIGAVTGATGNSAVDPVHTSKSAQGGGDNARTQ